MGRKENEIEEEALRKNGSESLCDFLLGDSMRIVEKSYALFGWQKKVRGKKGKGKQSDRKGNK